MKMKKQHTNLMDAAKTVLRGQSLYKSMKKRKASNQ